MLTKEEIKKAYNTIRQYTGKITGWEIAVIEANIRKITTTALDALDKLDEIEQKTSIVVIVLSIPILNLCLCNIVFVKIKYVFYHLTLTHTKCIHEFFYSTIIFL